MLHKKAGDFLKVFSVFLGISWTVFVVLDFTMCPMFDPKNLFVFLVVDSSMVAQFRSIALVSH